MGDGRGTARRNTGNERQATKDENPDPGGPPGPRIEGPNHSPTHVAADKRRNHKPEHQQRKTSNERRKPGAARASGRDRDLEARTAAQDARDGRQEGNRTPGRGQRRSGDERRKPGGASAAPRNRRREPRLGRRVVGDGRKPQAGTRATEDGNRELTAREPPAVPRIGRANPASGGA